MALIYLRQGGGAPQRRGRRRRPVGGGRLRDARPPVAAVTPVAAPSPCGRPGEGRPTALRVRSLGGDPAGVVVVGVLHPEALAVGRPGAGGGPALRSSRGSAASVSVPVAGKAGHAAVAASTVAEVVGDVGVGQVAGGAASNVLPHPSSVGVTRPTRPPLLHVLTPTVIHPRCTAADLRPTIPSPASPAPAPVGKHQQTHHQVTYTNSRPDFWQQ